MLLVCTSTQIITLRFKLIMGLYRTLQNATKLALPPPPQKFLLNKIAKIAFLNGYQDLNYSGGKRL